MTDDDVPFEQDRDVIEPGSPTVENVTFVVLGVLSTLAVVLRMTGVLG